jgi:hypothetical protein
MLAPVFYAIKTWVELEEQHRLSTADGIDREAIDD